MKQVRKEMQTAAKSGKTVTQKTEKPKKKVVTAKKETVKKAAPKKTVKKAAPKKTVKKAAPKKTVKKAAPKKTVKKAAPKKTVKKAAPKKKAAKKPAAKKAEKKASTSKIDLVVGLIRKSRNGMNIDQIKKKTSLGDKQVWNLVYKAKKQGKITSPKKGVYVKA